MSEISKPATDMTHDSLKFGPKSGIPVAISFTEFRDGKIADFFANESRTFRPDTGAGTQGEFGSKRLVGKPHFATFEATSEKNIRKNAAKHSGIDFRPSGKSPCAKGDFGIVAATLDESVLEKNISSQRKRAQEPQFGKPTRPLASLLPPSNTVEEKKAGRVLLDPLAGKTTCWEKSSSARQTGSLVAVPTAFLSVADGVASDSPEKMPSLEESVLQRYKEVDDQLGRLLESWPRLPEDIRETITTLIDVAGKESH